MYNVHENMSLNSCILSIEYERKIVYNIITVKHKRKRERKNEKPQSQKYERNTD